jgi:hypothetical protein
VAVLLMGSVVGVPAVAAPNAISRALEKRAVVQAAAAKAAQEKAAEEANAAARKKAVEALGFDPFDPSATKPKSATSAAAARLLVQRIQLLQRAAGSRQGAVLAHRNMVMLAQLTAARRSPNTPPPYTEPRPGDPPRPGGTVPPGPQ